MTPTHRNTPAATKSPAHQTIFPPSTNHDVRLATHCTARTATHELHCAGDACPCDQAAQEPERWDGME